MRTGPAYLLNAIVSAGYGCADEPGGSGLSACEGLVPSGAPVDNGAVGDHVFTVTARDHEGHTATKSARYSVGCAFSGFTEPVDNLPVVNVVKAGQAIPLKWRLVDAASTPVTNLTAAAASSRVVACAPNATTDQVEATVAAGLELLNKGGGYYQLSWKTASGFAGSCRELLLDLGEGRPWVAPFRFR